MGVAVLATAIALVGPACGFDDDHEGTMPLGPLPPCPAGGVVVRVGPADGAAGLRAVELQATNCGIGPVPLEGYPGLRLLDADRAPLPVEVVRGSGIVEDPGPAPLVLATDESATTTLAWRNLVEAGPAVTGTFVEVTVADGVAPQLLEKAVDVGTTGRVELTAWAPLERRSG